MCYDWPPQEYRFRKLQRHVVDVGLLLAFVVFFDMAVLALWNAEGSEIKEAVSGSFRVGLDVLWAVS